jgi:hypothetical protein
MKSSLTKVSLALLSTVFLLGCQEQGSGVVGLDGTGIQAAKRGKPGKPGGGGGDDGNPVTPATITFRNCLGLALPDCLGADKIRSDTEGIYADQGEGGMRVFLGSQANTGNIFLQNSGAAGRELVLDFTGCSSDLCTASSGITSGTNNVDVVFLIVNVKDGIQDGVFALGADQNVSVPMRVRFIPNDNARQRWFLEFDPSVKNCGGSTKVTVTGVLQDSELKWEVEGTGQGCLIHTTGPSKKDHHILGEFSMPFKFTVARLAGD